MTLTNLLDDLYMIGFNSTWTPRGSSTPGFPFYNVIKLDADSFLVEVALAGYDENNIELSEHNSTLVIKGTSPSDMDGNYLYKGISARSFTRTFALAEHVHVESAKMNNGILYVSLKRDVPEEARPKRIAIESPKAAIKAA